MSNTPTRLDHEDYLIEELGFSVEECESIFGQLNGIEPDMRYPLPLHYLKMELLAGADASAIDHATYGRDLSFPKDDSPEMPKIIKALAEKVGRLAPWQQDAVAFFAFGFWSGIGTAARQREELTPPSAVPRGRTEH